MDTHKFHLVYGESRNGTDGFTRHPLARKLIYSDGVAQLADLGCHWLLDIIGTELPPVFRDPAKNPSQIFFGIVTADMNNKQAVLTLTWRGADEGDAIPWMRKIDFTTLPDGKWVFYLANDDGEGRQYSLILPSEY